MKKSELRLIIREEVRRLIKKRKQIQDNIQQHIVNNLEIENELMNLEDDDETNIFVDNEEN